MIRGVTQFDIHAPDEDKPSVKAVELFIKDWKPDYVVWGGDLGHWQSFSHWEKEFVSDSSTTKDFDAVDNIIIRQQALCKAQFIWLQGNHDEWCEKYCKEVENIRHTEEYNILRRLKLKERNIKFIQINKPFKVGKLRFIHGLYLNEHHAKKTLLAYNANVVYGHCHSQQVFTHVSPIDISQVRTGRSRPCLCNLNPDYLKNRPNAWTHGFSAWYVRDDGYFNEYCVDITKGIFTFNDKTYDGNLSNTVK